MRTKLVNAGALVLRSISILKLMGAWGTVVTTMTLLLVSTPIRAMTYDLSFSNDSEAYGTIAYSAARFAPITLFDGDILSIVFFNVPALGVGLIQAGTAYDTSLLELTGGNAAINEEFSLSDGHSVSGPMALYGGEFNFQEITGCCVTSPTTWTISLSLLSGEPAGSSGLTVYQIEAQVSNFPLPAALPLFATGLGAMGLLGWRRKRKNAAGIAARLT